MLTLVLQGMVLANGDNSYEKAYKEAEKSGKPLLVLVGADWCGGCVVMKQHTIPNMVRRGELNRVSLAMVDFDNESSLAHQIMRGTSLPQLFMYSKTDKGWKRAQIVGPASEDQIREFIDRGMQIHVAAKPSSELSAKN
jgi:thioredoxin-like negative regulator of GroEL